ncbi:hypothetical protein ACEPAI_10077 [Sanghuangporus weigelae]
MEGRTELDVIELPTLSYFPGPSRSIWPRSMRTWTQTRDVEQIEASKLKRVEYVSIAALMWAMFLMGWNDGTAGPLLPALQRNYHVGFAIVSLVFVANGVGFVSASIANVSVAQKVGFGKTLVIGSLAQLAAYAVQCSAPPFPVFALAYVASGVGVSLQLAQIMDFAVSLNKNADLKMAILQASYGIGALCSPLVATQFAAMSNRWSFHFLVSLGCAIINTASLAIVFRFKPLNDVLEKAGQTIRPASASQGNRYAQIFRLKVVHFLAFFIFAYVGVEVALAGWIVTFVIDERGGGSSSGYLTSGFFGGVTVGRLCLLWLNRLVGERRVIWLYILLSIGLEITIWLVPSLVANAVAVSLIGVFLGPIYPIVMNITGRLIPHWLMSGAIGWIAGFGQAGTAVVPFVTGAMASKFGVMSLQPLIVTILAIMVGLWAAVPPDQQRSD